MKNLLCKIIGHKYFVVKDFDYTSRCVSCERCKHFWAMNDNVKAFLDWDGEFSQLYNWSPFKLKLPPRA